MQTDYKNRTARQGQQDKDSKTMTPNTDKQDRYSIPNTLYHTRLRYQYPHSHPGVVTDREQDRC